MSDRVDDVTFDLPATFQPIDFLTGRLQLRADDARWLISTILRKTANRDTDVWGCVRLHSDILRRVMDGSDSPDVIRALQSGGAIEIAPYRAGVKSTGFRLAARYLGDRCVRIRAVDPRLVARLTRERERQKLTERKDRWQPVHFDLANEQRHITIDDEVDSLMPELPEHTRLCQDVLVSNLKRRTYQFSVGTTGRVFNSITGLKRDLRTALRINSEEVGSVDIVCAQPALLAILLSTAIGKTNTVLPFVVYLSCMVGPIGKDFAAFHSAVCDGTFYDQLCHHSGLTRAAIKLRFLVDVLAKRGRYHSDVEDLFKKSFPTVFRAIRRINSEDHGNLIRLLQRAESWLVVEQVAPRLLANRVNVVTLHDAIFSAESSVDDVHSAFVEVLSETGFSLSLKKEVA